MKCHDLKPDKRMMVPKYIMNDLMDYSEVSYELEILFHILYKVTR